MSIDKQPGTVVVVVISTRIVGVGTSHEIARIALHDPDTWQDDLVDALREIAREFEEPP